VRAAAAAACAPRADFAAAEPEDKAKAAAKANAKGTMKKKVLKKRFSTTFHRCVPPPRGCGGRGSGAAPCAPCCV